MLVAAQARGTDVVFFRDECRIRFVWAKACP